MANEIAVLITCSSMTEARRIARALVANRLAACVNIVRAPVESIYWWKGKLQAGREFLLIAKTLRTRFTALEKEIRRLHSYDTPEIIALPISRGSRDYLRWLADAVRFAEKRRTKPS